MSTLRGLVVGFGFCSNLWETKCLPAIYRLLSNLEEDAPEHLTFLGTGTKPLSGSTLFEYLEKGCRRVGSGFDPQFFRDWVVPRFRYCQLKVEDPKAFEAFAAEVRRLHRKTGGQILYHVALWPQHQLKLMHGLAQAKLIDDSGHIAVEKPIGRDLETAREMIAAFDHVAGPHWSGIDHWIAKPGVGNLLWRRVANPHFESTYHGGQLERLELSCIESRDNEGRRGFPPEGAIRDVLSSHVAMTLAMATMNLPSSTDPEAIRAARLEALLALEPLRPEDVVLGCYAGYRQEVADMGFVGRELEDSQHSPTLVAARAWSRLPNWHAGPNGRTELIFRYMKSGPVYGKRFVTTYRGPEHPMAGNFDWPVSKPQEIWELEPPFTAYQYLNGRNSSTLELRPERHVLVSETRQDSSLRPDEYAHLFYDGLNGDRSSFVTGAEVEAGWKFVQDLLRHGVPVDEYDRNSWAFELCGRVSQDWHLHPWT